MSALIKELPLVRAGYETLASHLVLIYRAARRRAQI